ncbi:LysR family transcriptional regulator [Sinorhizobium meliloti]|uniref:LysR family transcriptional regulator n=1 Tax=Rhizobium meliloti TaxID=382 RepID=UPI0020902293|nr:LysR family transcriptional regulator [Sinorhizobium meliloti]MCO5966254.1 LysR family transcriptional regulator [Sinorhizobium meliloti]
MSRPLRSLNARQIEAFRAVMVSGSITRAGRLLSISQPAVTRLIHNLEIDLGMPLFTRVGATVAPTPEARAFFIEVEKYFVSTDRLREAAMIIREHGAGRLRIATINALSGTCLPDAIRDFAAEFPDILLSVHTGVSSDIIDLVAKGQVDIGFVALPPGRTDLDFRPLPASEVVCVLPKDHPLAARSAIGPADLHEQDYVALGPGSLMRLELHALLRAADAHPRLRIESLFSGTVVHYVERGLGIAVIDPLAALVVDPARTTVRRFVPRIRYELSVVYAPSVGRSPMFDGLVACLVKHYSRIVREVVDRLA